MINVVKKPIKVNGKEKTGIYYYAAFSRKGTADTIGLAEQMNEGSSAFTKGEVVGVTLDLPIRVRQALLAGQAVRINGLGTFKPSLSVREIKENPDELKTSAITIKGINFIPESDLLTVLNARAEYEWISAEKASSEDDGSTDQPSDDTPSGGDTPAEGGEGGGSNDDTTPPTDGDGVTQL